jgi:uroporphyrinogen decarboxylase
MNNRQRALAILNYQPYDRLPIVHFGFWDETLKQWAAEEKISWEEATHWADGNEHDLSVGKKLGFDFNWGTVFSWNHSLFPAFERRVLKEHPDGRREVINVDGVVIIQKDDAGSIPTEIAHLLKDRKSWEEHYLPRLQWSPERVDWQVLERIPEPEQRDQPFGLMCGSMIGRVRDITGLMGLSYLLADDPLLVEEMIEVTAEVCYQGVKAILEHYDRFDFAHFWEDICYRAGPLVNPKFFDEKVTPHYRRITDLTHAHGIPLASLDCDGKIDKLIPGWIKNGVNTMFPMEVGVWNANIAPWREQFGKELRGVGGMNKVIFSRDFAAVDAEIERLRPLVELGGYIPCPDHRLAPDAKWENIQYYCERMRLMFG